MNDCPRDMLARLVAEIGPVLCDDPYRCKALLLKHCPEHQREINVLIAAMEQRVPADLLAAPGDGAWEQVSWPLVRRLADNLAMQYPAAEWAVDSWGVALVRRPPHQREIVIPEPQDRPITWQRVALVAAQILLGVTVGAVLGALAGAAFVGAVMALLGAALFAFCVGWLLLALIGPAMLYGAAFGAVIGALIGGIKAANRMSG